MDQTVLEMVTATRCYSLLHGPTARNLAIGGIRAMLLDLVGHVEPCPICDSRNLGPCWGCGYGY